jgi:23S rRNA pseudouridine955/2504/2580 synthase
LTHEDAAAPFDFASCIVWEGEGLVAVDKPAGVLSQPGSDGPNLVDAARAHFRSDGVGVLHRLDRNVSGLVLLSTRKDVARAMSAQFARGAVDRRYVAIVMGSPGGTFAIDAWLSKDEELNTVEARDSASLTTLQRKSFVAARTEITVLERFSAIFGRAAEVEARPITGRSHQIRAHLAHAGFPIVGDAKYGQRVRGLMRPLLHARKITFVDPKSAKQTTLEAREPWKRSEIVKLRRY